MDELSNQSDVRTSDNKTSRDIQKETIEKLRTIDKKINLQSERHPWHQWCDDNPGKCDNTFRPPCYAFPNVACADDGYVDGWVPGGDGGGDTGGGGAGRPWPDPVEKCYNNAGQMTTCPWDGTCWDYVTDNSGAIPVTKIEEVQCIWDTGEEPPPIDPENPRPDPDPDPDPKPDPKPDPEPDPKPQPSSFNINDVIFNSDASGGSAPGGIITNNLVQVQEAVTSLTININDIISDAMRGACASCDIYGDMNVYLNYDKFFELDFTELLDPVYKILSSTQNILLKITDTNNILTKIENKINELLEKNKTDEIIEYLQKMEKHLSNLFDMSWGITEYPDIKVPEVMTNYLDNMIRAMENIAHKIDDNIIELTLINEKLSEFLALKPDEPEEPVISYENILNEILMAINNIEFPQMGVPEGLERQLDSMLMKMDEIIISIQTLDFSFDFDQIIDKTGTNFWDFLSGLFNNLFDLVEYLIDRIIYLVVPQNPDFVWTAVNEVTEAFQQKFEPVEEIKLFIQSSVIQEEKQFQDYHLNLPVYGEVMVFHTDFLTQAVPKFRSILSGVMLIITLGWAYRKISSDLIR